MVYANLINLLAGAGCKIGPKQVEIPETLTNITGMLYHAILIGVPVLLILFGMWDLGKAVMAQKEDEIKKGQQTFIKRLIAAVIVFLVYAIVNLVVGLLLGPKDPTMDCVRAILGLN